MTTPLRDPSTFRRLVDTLRAIRLRPAKAGLPVADPIVEGTGPLPQDDDEPERCDYCGAPAACCQQDCPEYRDMLADEYLDAERRWDDEH